MKTLAHWARTGNVEQIEALPAAGADPNAEETDTHWSPLVEAVYGNHAEAAFLLLEAGADMYAPTRSGTTPLTLAFQRGNIALVSSCVVMGIILFVNNRYRFDVGMTEGLSPQTPWSASTALQDTRAD